MKAHRVHGRPRIASRHLLEEAADELFLEQGYDATTVDQIARRAGVSRNTFFNYFSNKSDLLWVAFDDNIVTIQATLTEESQSNQPSGDDEAQRSEAIHAMVEAALLEFSRTFRPENVSLAFTQSETMSVDAELRRSRVARIEAVASTVREGLRSIDPNRFATVHLAQGGLASSGQLRAIGFSYAAAGALIAALEVWATAGAMRASFEQLVRSAYAPIRRGFAF